MVDANATTKAAETATHQQPRHTPGPWSISHWSRLDGDTGLLWKGVRDGIGYYAADVVGEPYFQIVAGKSLLGSSHTWADHQGPHIARVDIAIMDGALEEAVANARLLRAAPCLLKALRDVEYGGSDHNNDGEPVDVCPFCGGEKPTDDNVGSPYQVGHTDECGLAAAIAKATGGAR